MGESTHLPLFFKINYPMKKSFLLVTILLMASFAWAAQVDQVTAREIAQRFLASQADGHLKAPVAGSLELKFTAKSSVLGDASPYYVFNSPNGFVIVAGDERAQDILAYGDQPIRDMASLPAAMKYWLDCYQQQVEFLLANPDIKVDVPLRAAQTVNPLLTANWSQNAPYWNECPVFGTDTCYTGCPATSLSMVFHYWKYPQQQTPAVPSYMLPSYAIVLPELPPTTFDWNNMLDNYTGTYTDLQATAVAHLMRYIGQAEEMDYTISGSGALGKDILRAVKFFEYDQNAQLLFKTDDLGYANYSDARWAELIVNELTAGRPIVYCAYDNYTGSGHAFNVDGYDAATGTYHVNWGWNGRGNGNFALNAFSYGEYTFGTGQQMIIGIQPPEGYQSPRLQAYPNVLSMQTYINTTTTATVSLKGTNLTDDVTLTLNDANGVFRLDNTHLTQQQAEGSVDITVTYAPTTVGTHQATIVCTSDGCEPLIVTLNGEAPLEVYQPVMQPVNEAMVTLTSFRADWTDKTPLDNVACYTLEVMAKPAYSLLVEADFSQLPQMAPSNQASHATDYLPQGWSFGGSEFNLEGGCVSLRRNSTITTDVLDLKGYDKMTIEVTARAYGYYGDGSELYVTTSQGTHELVFMYAYETKTIVVDCAEAEQVVFKAGYYPMIRDIKIYAGDATQSMALNATETGGTDYRLVEDITTGKSCVVRNLTAGGSYLYKVKALYIDGTWSEWSNVEMVTLADGAHNYQLGDVNHDNTLDVSDVTLLIAYILGNDVDICTRCANANGDDTIDVADVTAMIAIILNN